MDRFDWVKSKLPRSHWVSITRKVRNPIFLVLPVTVAAIASGEHLLFPTASAQNQPLAQQSLTKQTRKPPENPRGPGVPGGGARPAPRNPRGPGVPGGGNLYEDILDQLREEKPDTLSTTTRAGGSICLVAPSGTNQGIWHDRPLFIWRGEAVQIELLAAGRQEVLWSKNLTANDTRAVYDGEPLQAGQRYQWRLYQSEQDVEGPILFRILPKEERDRLSAELNQLQTQGATAEEIALQRANYFAKKRMWADALQEIYSVENPSDQLNKLGEEITSYFCR
jgi:hypothetical protein